MQSNEEENNNEEKKNNVQSEDTQFVPTEPTDPKTTTKVEESKKNQSSFSGYIAGSAFLLCVCGIAGNFLSTNRFNIGSIVLMVTGGLAFLVILIWRLDEASKKVFKILAYSLRLVIFISVLLLIKQFVSEWKNESYAITSFNLPPEFLQAGLSEIEAKAIFLNQISLLNNYYRTEAPDLAPFTLPNPNNFKVSIGEFSMDASLRQFVNSIKTFFDLPVRTIRLDISKNQNAYLLKIDLSNQRPITSEIEIDQLQPTEIFNLLVLRGALQTVQVTNPIGAAFFYTGIQEHHISKRICIRMLNNERLNSRDSAILLAQLGIIYARERKFQAAAEKTRAVIRINPDSAFNYSTLARILGADKKFDESRAQFEVALTKAKSSSQWTDIMSNYIDILLDAGDTVSARLKTRNLAKISQGSVESTYWLSYFFTIEEKYDSAENQLNKLENLLMSRGSSLYSLLTDLNSFAGWADTKPDSKYKFFFGALRNVESNNISAAIIDFQKSVETDSTFYSGYFGLAIAYQLNGNNYSALECVTRLEELRPNSATNNSKIICYENLGEFDLAENLLRSNLVNNSLDIWSLQQYFNIIGNKNTQSKFDYFLNYALALRPYDTALLKLQFDRLWSSDRKKAVGSLHKFLEVAPNNLSILAQLAFSQYEMNNYISCLDACNRIINIDPKYARRFGIFDLKERLRQGGEIDQSDSEKAVAFFGLGSDRFKAKKYQDAIVAFTNFINLVPKDVAAFLNRGLAKREIGKYEEAIDDFDKAIELNPGNTIAHSSRGEIKISTQKFLEALADFDSIIKYSPNNALAYAKRGYINAILGKFQEALSDYEKALIHNPKDTITYLNRGIIRMKRNEFNDAIADFDNVIRYSPRNSEAYAIRGAANGNLGHYQKALSDFGIALTHNPKDTITYLNRGIIRMKRNEFKDAITDFDNVIRFSPRNSEAYARKGAANAKLGQYQQALSDYENALIHNPKDTLVYFERGTIRMVNKEFKDAITDFDKVISYNFKAASAYLLRGNAKQTLGNLQGALADYDEAIRLNQEDTTAYYFRGILYMSQQKIGEAVADFESAQVKSRPMSVFWFLSGGLKEMLNEEFQKAIDNFNKLIAREPKNGEAFYFRGICRFMLGQKKAACLDFLKSKELGISQSDRQGQVNELIKQTCK